MRTRIVLIPVLLGLILGVITVEGADVAGPWIVLQVKEEKKADQPETYDVNYTYNPEGRRDPFIDLAKGQKVKTLAPKGALTVTDAKIVGITQSKDGYTAIIMGSDNKARFMKAGDKLYDGQIIAIEKERVIFRQDFTEENPAAPGLRSKEVEKRLNPVQEGT